MNIFRNHIARSLRYLCLAGVVALGLVAIIATGGGGGGDGVAPLTYTGITAQATVNDGNAETLSTGAFLGGHVGSAMSLGVIVQAGEIGRPRTLKASQVLGDAVRRIDMSSALTDASSRAVFSQSDTFSGTCGGSATYTISIDDSTVPLPSFSGQLIFSGYCEEGVTASGNAFFYGFINPGPPAAPVEFTVTFTFLSVTAAGGDSFATSGSIYYNYQPVLAEVNIDALFRDNTTWKVYWINNYSMTLDVQPGYVDVSMMSGRFYDPDYGWVAVSTPTTPFRINAGYEWPSQGVLIIEGQTDPAFLPGPSGARLEALGTFEYVVDCEYGDDDPPAYDDLTIGPLPWS